MPPKILPFDPRPSKAHPDDRAHRKQLQKDHPAFGWVEPILLGLMGITIFMNIEKQVEKHEQKHKEEDERERKKQQRGSQAGAQEPRHGEGGRRTRSEDPPRGDREKGRREDYHGRDGKNDDYPHRHGRDGSYERRSRDDRYKRQSAHYDR